MSGVKRDALLKRIEELEMENKTAKKELYLCKKNMRLGDSPSLQTGSHSHYFIIKVKTDVEEYQSMPHTIDGVEFAINIHRCFIPITANRQPSDRTNTRFSLSWNIKNTDPTGEKFVLLSTDVECAERPSSDQESIPHCPSFSQYFILHRNEEYLGEKRRLDHINSRRPSWKIMVRLTAVVQPIESSEIDVDNTAVVIVKNKEFRVSVDYLSMWSLYFRAYFRVDMKEKQEGRYPIGDDDIEPEDFQELLDVIHPTSKDISKDNVLLLLRLANRFEMPSLTRRIELFMIEFGKNRIRLADAFRIASDVYSLKIVQTMLLNRWRDPLLMEEELLKSEEYDQLSSETKALVHERFTQAFISSKGTNSKRAADQDRRMGGASSPPHRDERGGFGSGRDRGFNNPPYQGGFNDRARQNRGGFGRGFADPQHPWVDDYSSDHDHDD